MVTQVEVVKASTGRNISFHGKKSICNIKLIGIKEGEQSFPSKALAMRKSIEKSCDRISELPDAVLDSVLSLVAIKCVIRTSVLSTRWRNLWKNIWAHAATLDFGKEFAKAQTEEEFVTTVNRYLELHNSGKIEKFLLYFHPGDQYKAAEVEKWIGFASARGVKELDLNFCRETLEQLGADYKERLSLPDILFACGSLIHLSLSHTEFNPSLEFRGFNSLETLELNQVNISDDVLESILSSCPLLTTLCLRLCSKLGSIKISGGSNLQLRCLSLILVTDAYELDILAPNLKSFHFYGDLLYGYSFRNVVALEDVFISSDGCEFTEPEHDYVQILSGVSHIKVLTMCIGPPMYVTMCEEYLPDKLPITLPNLQELQILIGGRIGEEYLGYVFGFFKHTVCPCLEKLFIDQSGSYLGSYSPWLAPYAKLAEESFNCLFNNLKTIKVNHFGGSETEMKMVQFFLDRVITLESLVLVVVDVVANCHRTEIDSSNIKDRDGASTCKRRVTPAKKLLLVDQLVMLPKASKDAQIFVFDEWEEVDTSLRPLHSRTDYHDYY